MEYQIKAPGPFFRMRIAVEAVRKIDEEGLMGLILPEEKI